MRSTASIGRWSAHRPWRAIAVWLAFVAGALAVGSITGTSGLPNGAIGEAARGYSLMDEEGLWGPAHEFAYLHSPKLDAGDAAFAAARRDVARRFTALGLTVRSSSISGDGHSAVVAAADDGSVPIERIRATVAAAARAYPAFTIAETGDISADQARHRLVHRDLHRAEWLSVPVSLLVLLFAFGTLVAALVPVLLALTAVAATFGLLGPISHLFPVQDNAKTFAFLIGMAVGVDYALFYVMRSREERRRGHALEAALLTTSRTSGRTVLVSGTTVAIAIGGMYLVAAKFLNGIASATIAVIACAVAGSVTVLPALLRLLGPRIDRGRIPWLPHLRSEGGRFWPGLINRVLRRPVLAALLSASLLVALALPALDLRLSKPSDLALSPQSEPALRTLAAVQAAFPGAGDAAYVVVRVPRASRSAARSALARLRRLALADGITHAPIDLTSNRDRTAAALALPLAGNGANGSSRRAVEELRRRLLPETLGRVPGAETAVTGHTAEDIDFTRQMRHSIPFVIAFVLVFAFCLLLVAFRSLVVPLKAIVLNLLSVGASYGVLALVFQHHWAQGILGFRSNGTIVSWLPLFLFVVLFGLSMDYHVFILSRVREAVDRGQPTEEAVRHGITATAGVVTSAALVMIAVFSIFGTLSSLEIKQSGVGLAVAVFLDVTVIRAVLLPASMKLLGDWNWYLPRALSRLPQPHSEKLG